MVKPLFKGNIRMDPLGALDVNNYRGISLTSCVGKLLEKIIALRIEQHVGAHAPLSETQNGFRPKRSSVSHVWSVLETLAMKGPNSLVLFYDLKKACPSVRRSSLLSALHSRGVHGAIWKLVAAFYDNTSGVVKVGHFVDPEAYDV